MVAPRIVERYIFRYMAGPEYVGHAREAKIAFRVVSGGKDLHIFTTSKDSIHQRRLFPLLDTMAEHCGIKDSTSLRLLDAAINESRTDRIHSAFADAGYGGHDNKQGRQEHSVTRLPFPVAVLTQHHKTAHTLLQNNVMLVELGLVGFTPLLQSQRTVLSPKIMQEELGNPILAHETGLVDRDAARRTKLEVTLKHLIDVYHC